MALTRDPDWLARNSVTGLEFGAEAQPRKPDQWPQGSGGAEGVIKALTYQLRERMAFVPAPDPLVGSLIADLAVMLMLYRSVDFALPVFDLALSYRPARSEQVAARKSKSEEIHQSEADADRNFKLALMGFAVLAIGGGIFLKARQGS